MPTDAAKASLLAALREMAAAGLSPGASGNASVRARDGMWISASGIAAADATADTLVFVEQGKPPPGTSPKASSEWQLHQQIYADHPDADAIVHCHSRYATSLACQRRGIPAFHYMVAVAGGDDIPCAEYAEFGSGELARAVSDTLQHRRACLMANHGQIAIGDTPEQALALAKDIEELAAQFQLSQLSGEPVLLSDAEMATVLLRFKTYGQSL